MSGLLGPTRRPCQAFAVLLGDHAERSRRTGCPCRASAV